MKRPRLKKATREAMLERDSYACKYCGRSVTKETAVVDYNVPISEGGSSELDNLVTACANCNMSMSKRFISGIINKPVSQKFADTWIKYYLKAPIITAIFSILGVALTVVVLMENMYGYQDKNASNFSQPEFSSQIEQLNRTQESLKSLTDFVANQKRSLERSQESLDNIEQERERLEPLLNSDRDVVEAIFSEQERRNAETQTRERWIGFGLGVLASIVASVFTIVARFFLNINKMA